jgi:hypothetical protein
LGQEYVDLYNHSSHLLGIVLNWLSTRTTSPLLQFQKKVYIGKKEELRVPSICFRNSVKIISSGHPHPLAPALK